MTDKLRAAAEAALEVLVSQFDGRADAIDILSAALAEPKERQSTHSAECYKWHHACAVARIERAQDAEPVAQYSDIVSDGGMDPRNKYDHAPRREWVGLTDDDIDRVTDAQWARNNDKPIYAAYRAYARAVEAALKEKNNHDPR